MDSIGTGTNASILIMAAFLYWLHSRCNNYSVQIKLFVRQVGGSWEMCYCFVYGQPVF